MDKKFRTNGCIAIVRHPTFHIKHLKFHQAFATSAGMMLLVSITEFRQMLEANQQFEKHYITIFYNVN